MDMDPNLFSGGIAKENFSLVVNKANQLLEYVEDCGKRNPIESSKSKGRKG